MPFLPHDKEFKGDLSTLPKNAHAIQKLDDKLISSYSHHGFLLMTVVSPSEHSEISKLIDEDTHRVLHHYARLTRLPVPESLQRDLEEVGRGKEAYLHQPPCPDLRKDHHDCSCPDPLLAHRQRAS